ncbi:MAG: hypothetical protein ACTSVV_08060, partial [Promethearchaeota archaeon]
NMQTNQIQKKKYPKREQVELEKIIDMPIKIDKIFVKEGQFGKNVVIMFNDNKITFTGSKIVVEQVNDINVFLKYKFNLFKLIKNNMENGRYYYRIEPVRFT